MNVPKVYQAINAVAADLGKRGIAKLQTNTQDSYQFRGIDDVYNGLSPALASHGLCILPRVLERVSADRAGDQGNLLVSVSVKVAFDLVSVEDGSVHVIESYGEALDSGDKATSKAMTAAFKYAVLQAFCIPLTGMGDADATSHRLQKADHAAEPVQGWDQWVVDIVDVVRLCETGEALHRLQDTNRGLLKAIRLERPELYSSLGESIGQRRKAITSKIAVKPASGSSGESGKKPPVKKAPRRRRPAAPKAAIKGNGGEAHAPS